MNLKSLSRLLVLIVCCGLACSLQAKSRKADPNFIEDTRTQAYKGDAVAQCAFGNCFEEGYGVPRNFPEALKWYRRSADQKDPLGQYYLGRCYETGHGLEKKDMTEAVKWYRLSAEQGCGPAQYSLAVCLFRAKGTFKNLVEADKWCTLAAQQNIAEAKQLLAKLDRKLKPDQLTQARQMAASFSPPHPLLVEEADDDTADLNEHPKTSGTGFFVTDDGYIVTSSALVQGAAKVRVVCGQHIYRADIAALDSTNGLALLKTKGWFEHLPVQAETSLQPSNTVYTVGFSNLSQQGVEARMYQGRVAALSGPQGETNLLELNMPLETGNLGGALLDTRGNAVGVIATTGCPTGSTPKTTLNAAIKGNALLQLLDSVPQTTPGRAEVSTNEEPYQEVIKAGQQATVMVVVY